MITVCGEAVVDLVGVPGEPRTYRAHPGGSPLNVAVGLARLGTPVSFAGRLSGDSFGRLLRAHLTASGVDLGAAVVAVEPTSVAVADVDGTGRASYAFYVQGTADWQWTPAELPPPVPAGGVLHVGSLALALEPGARTLEGLVLRERGRGTLVCFDPNIRPTLEPDLAAARTRVTRQVELADLVKVSREDLEVLHPDEAPETVARHWAGLGPQAVVVTDGPAGATAFTPAGQLHRPAPRIEVADTVGAGDAFTAGLLDAVRRAAAAAGTGCRQLVAGPGADWGALLEDAVTVAALTCTRPGADPPEMAEVRAWRARTP